ncbi:hypothetical protein PFISCL1PPCAC_1013, partial [Pristionchus fissidentatus]
LELDEFVLSHNQICEHLSAFLHSLLEGHAHPGPIVLVLTFLLEHHFNVVERIEIVLLQLLEGDFGGVVVQESAAVGEHPIDGREETSILGRSRRLEYLIDGLVERDLRRNNIWLDARGCNTVDAVLILF